MNEREAQQQYEEETDTVAASKKLDKLREESAAGNMDLPHASRLIAHMFITLQDCLNVEAETATLGRGNKFKGWLRAVPKDVAAVIVFRECISVLSRAESSVTMQTLASNIGRLWELEIRIKEAERVNPLYMKRVHTQIRERNTTDPKHIRKVYNFAYSQVMKGELDSQLSQSDAIQFGKYGVQAGIDAGLLVSTRSTIRMQTHVQFHLAPELQEYLTGYEATDVCCVTDKEAGAMLCPPDEWTNLDDGGYLSPRRKLAAPLMKLQFLRASEKPRLRAAFTAENMPMVFQVANYLQSREFKLHTPSVTAMCALWQDGGGVLGVPSRNKPAAPPCPLPEAWDKASGTPEELDAFTTWKRAMVAHYETVSKWRAHVREIGGHLKATTRHAGKSLWYPIYMDTRGRWYYRGTPNPQGSDLAKGAIHFAKKKPLGVRGLFWLKVHIANSFGFDKERMQDRADWTDKNWPSIEQALEKPEDHPDVWGDSPWCMFSAAWELREAYRSGDPKSYCTGIVIHMDATCSGLQHFSAMLRDPVGATYVNITDELQCGPKQDIYSRVSTVALQAMQRDLDSADEDVRVVAKWWISKGIPRSMSKRPIMTFVYGATLSGTCDHIEQFAVAELGVKWPNHSEARYFSQYCAKKLFEGIACTVPAAENAMNWLRSMARMQPRGKRMEWSTPSGFLVQHDYQGFDERRVDVRSCGLTKIMVRQTNEDTRPIQMQNAIAPNFVHALDATHLTFTARRMEADGLDMVGIHDSFGTHPCDVDAMHVHIREAFVELYHGRNILGEFLWDIGTAGEPPMRGDLDVRAVLDSEFFFS